MKKISSTPDQDRYCTATEAARTLGVKPATLYAYASRGLLQSMPLEGTRRKGYLLSEIQALKQRHQRVRDPTSAARSALDWGLPVLDTELTLIEDGKFYYRGIDAVVLAGESSLERVAALLWLGEQEREAQIFGEALQPVPKLWRQAVAAEESVHPSTRLLLAVQLEEMAGAYSGGTGVNVLAETGGGIVRCLFSAAASLDRRRRGPLVDILLNAWCPGRAELGAPLSAALILSADHELNVSSFTARCITSAGSSLYEVVCGGLCALRGFRHGGHSDRVEALLREVGIQAKTPAPTRREVRRRLRSRLERGEQLPGFSHPLYPEGDPRYEAIMESLQKAAPRSKVARGVRRVAEEGAVLAGGRPTLDLGLAALSAEAGLPLGTAWMVFALGRTIGWIAHAMEEGRREKLIRPRARYVGRPIQAARCGVDGKRGVDGRNGTHDSRS